MAIYLGAGALNQQLADRQNVIKEAAASRMYGAERVRQDFVGLGESAIDLIKNYGTPEWMGGSGVGAQHVAYAKDMYGAKRQVASDKRDERQLAMYEQSNHIKNLVTSIDLDNKLIKSRYYKGQKPAALLKFFEKVQTAHQNEVGTISSIRLMDKYKGMYSPEVIAELAEYRKQFAGNPGGEPLSSNTEAQTYLQNLAGQTITDQEEWYVNNGLVDKSALLKESAYIPVLRNYLSKVLGMPMPEAPTVQQAELVSLGGNSAQTIEEQTRLALEDAKKKKEAEALKKAAKEETEASEGGDVTDDNEGVITTIQNFIKKTLSDDDEAPPVALYGRDLYKPDGTSIAVVEPPSSEEKMAELMKKRHQPDIDYTGLEEDYQSAAFDKPSSPLIEASVELDEAVKAELPPHLRGTYKFRNPKDGILSREAQIALNRVKETARLKKVAEEKARALELKEKRDAEKLLRQHIVPIQPYTAPPGLPEKIKLRDDLEKLHDGLNDPSIPYDKSKYNNITRAEATRKLRGQLRSARADVRALEDKTLIQDGTKTISMERYEKQLKDINKQIEGMSLHIPAGMTLPQKLAEKKRFMTDKFALEDQRDLLRKRYEKAEFLAKEAGIQFTGNELNISSSTTIPQIQNSTFEDTITKATMKSEGNGDANNPGMPYQDAGGLFILAGGLNLAGHVEHWSSGKKDGVVEKAYPGGLDQRSPQAVALRKYLDLKQPALKSGSTQGWEWIKDERLKLDTEPRAILTRFMLNEGALGMIRTTPKLAKTRGDTILNQEIAPNLRHFLKDMSIRFGPAWLKSSQTPWAEAFRKELEIYLEHVGKGPGHDTRRYEAKLRMIDAFIHTPTYKAEIKTGSPRQKKLVKLLREMKTSE